MEHSQYYHFSSRAHEVTDVVVLPAEGHDHIRCFADQVKMTCALVRDLDEVVKEIKQLGEHGEEASWKITELEALCKQQAKAAQNLREEKATLEGKVESRDELIMEIADEFGYNHMDEDANDEEDDSDEDDDDKGDTVAPPVATPPAAAPKVIIIEEEEEDPVEMVPMQEAPEAHEVILLEA
jgi:hypothetical protein